MKLWIVSTWTLILLSRVKHILMSDGSAGAKYSDPNEGHSKMSQSNNTEERSLFEFRPVITVDVLVGKAADLQCRSETGEGKLKWWQTPFGSFGGETFSDKDPIDINNGTLRIIRATSSHTGLYLCYLVDSRGTRLIQYSVHVKDREASLADASVEYDLALGVVPSVLVTFVVAFTLGALSRSYVITCLQKTQTRMGQKRSSQRIRDIGLFRTSTQKSSQGSGTPKLSTKWFCSDKTIQQDENEDETNGAQNRPEAEEPQMQPKRRSRVIKLYNYDEEGKIYSNVTEPEVLVEDGKAEPRHRVMSLTRLSAIMSQADTPDFSASRKSADNSSVKIDNSPKTESLNE